MAYLSVQGPLDTRQALPSSLCMVWSHSLLMDLSRWKRQQVGHSSGVKERIDDAKPLELEC